ncbi:hypothetical protein Cantr_04392 [Candida viswanathii]|uniref:Protein BIG1 n=1 Tax=Candida viswanathii TaxID=5486 RepID=A0A367XLD2_9ASCO|nr:hypothetical protein Cantr_04392 [Candida viswanathii]
MVSITQSLTYLGFMAPLAMAFSNSAPIIIDPLLMSQSVRDEIRELHKQVIKFDEVQELLARTTADICGAKDKLYIYQVDELNRDDGLKKYLEFSFRDVVYHDRSSVNFTISDKCYEEGLIEYEHLEAASAADILSRHETQDKVIIQGLPTFRTKGSLDSIKEKMYDLYNDDDIIINKRDDKEDGEDEAHFEEEIEHDFEEAESLAAEETDLVSIFDNDKDFPSNGTLVKPDNLFTNYQFFTSGIWSGIIVSLFLVSILYGALSWLTSLEITYASFEKQVDYDKKNE